MGQTKISFHHLQFVIINAAIAKSNYKIKTKDNYHRNNKKNFVAISFHLYNQYENGKVQQPSIHLEDLKMKTNIFANSQNFSMNENYFLDKITQFVDCENKSKRFNLGILFNGNIIEMGCVALKNEMINFSASDYREEDETDRDQKKSEDQTQADSCSESLTVSARSPRERIEEGKFLKENNYFGKKLRKILKGSLWSGTKNNFYKLIGPGFENNNYEVLCEEKNIPLLIHLMYGFLAENVTILSLNQRENRTAPKSKHLGIISKKSKESHRIVGSKYDVHILLKEKVSIFVKLQVTCECCHKKTLITQCRALFVIDNINCECKFSQIRILIVKTEPSLIQIWSDELEETISTPHFSKDRDCDTLLRKQTKLRVFGCTSCWGFGEIKRRQSCPCAVCPSCEPLNCQLCNE